MFIRICQLLIAFLARSILFLTGWKLFSPKALQRLHQHPRGVLVFSHSSYFDFVFLLLYRAAHPDALSDLRTLVKPQVFTYAGWFLRSMGCIPSTRSEDKNGGAVDRIVGELKSSPRSLFAISPKGTRSRNSWRSGYYHVAQKLEAPVLAVGVDYERKAPYVSTPFWGSDEPTLRSKLQSKLGRVVPLYPEYEVMPIRPHAPFHVIHLSRLIALGCILILVGVITSL
jgi:1-acyl-sn-glycerol-3-phosphate acyltransferase